jgi:hypothetical protein
MEIDERSESQVRSNDARASLQAESERIRSESPADKPQMMPMGFPSLTIEPDDGKYTRDTQGRVTDTVSASGQTRRHLAYEDPNNPHRITSLTINGKTEFRYAAPVTANGQPIEESGHEVNTYAVYQNGVHTGYWSGILTMNKNGVLSIRNNGDRGPIRREGSAGELGHKESDDRSFDGSEKRFTSAEFTGAKKTLLDAASRAGIDTKRFAGYISEFEASASVRGVQEGNATTTLKNLRDALNATSSPLYARVQLIKAVETAMHNIARPMEIEQGSHPTCNVTTLEVYAATRHPEQYSRLVKEVATTGQYKTSEGKTVTPPKNALRPGEDENAYDLNQPNSGRRNLASQIVQMTLINGLYESGGVIKSINGQNLMMTNTRYVMESSPWVSAGPGWVRRVGEDRLADAQGRPTQISNAGPNFTQTEILGASKMMLGYEMPYMNAPTSADGGRTWSHDLPSSDRLMQLKRENKLPVGISTLGGAHVQTIHDVMINRAGHTYVLLDNQYAENSDGWATLQDVHNTQLYSNYGVVPAIRRWQRPRD